MRLCGHAKFDEVCPKGSKVNDGPNSEGQQNEEFEDCWTETVTM